MNYFKTNFLPFLLISQIAFGGSIVYEEQIDDFTDEPSYLLIFLADSHTEQLPRILVISCGVGDIALLIQNGFHFSYSNRSNVLVRFDKKEAYLNGLNLDSNGLISTTNEEYIKKFLDEAVSSNDLVIGTEGNAHTMRFSNFSGDRQKITQFLETIKTLESCKLN